MRHYVILAILPLLGACAMQDTPEARAAAADREADIQAELAHELRGMSPGEPVSCISLPRITSSKVIGERVLLYKAGSNLVYRNDPVGGCPGLDDGSALITRTPGTRLCSGEIATVQDLRVGVPHGSCVFSEWVPYRKAKG